MIETQHREFKENWREENLKSITAFAGLLNVKFVLSIKIPLKIVSRLLIVIVCVSTLIWRREVSFKKLASAPENSARLRTKGIEAINIASLPAT